MILLHACTETRVEKFIVRESSYIYCSRSPTFLRVQRCANAPSAKRDVNKYIILFFPFLSEPDARAEVPWQSHGTGSALLHEANGDRRRVHTLAEGCSSGPKTGQHVPVGPDDRQDRRLWTGDQTRRST